MKYALAASALFIMAAILSGCGPKTEAATPAQAPAASTPAAVPAEIKDRMDICNFTGSEKPAELFSNYGEDNYDNSVLDLKGKSMFFDKPSGFRCGAIKLEDGSDSGMYSTDNILFTTSPDERSIRMVRITMGQVPHFEAFSQAMQAIHGSGKVLKSNVETRGELRRGEEIRVLQSATRYFYIDTVYMGRFQVGSISILMRNDTEAIAKMDAELMHEEQRAGAK